MLNKEELLRLNQKQDYKKIYSIFAEEYKNLLIIFYQKNNIDIPENPSFAHLVSMLANVSDGKYADIADYITEIFFNDDTLFNDSITMAIDMYNKTSSILKA